MRPPLTLLRLVVLLAFVGCAAGCATCRLPTPADGAEARVNTSLPGDQREATAALSARASVVVWSDDGAASAGRGIFGQRFDIAGGLVGVEFRVDSVQSAPDVIARVPDVAMNASGASVVVWEVAAGAVDTSAVDVFARRYDRAGRALGTRIRVSTAPSHLTAVPAVAVAASGAFAVAWQSDGSAPDTPDVLVRHFSAQGVAPDGPSRVNGSTVRGQGQTAPDIAMAPGGASVVVWFDSGRNGEGDVLARRYGAGGAAEGDTLRVHASSPQLAEQVPAVAMDASGAFVVAWQTAAPVGSNHGLGITAQRFNAAGDSVGGPVAVSPAADVSQSLPAVAVGPGGRAHVVWQRARPQLSTEPVQLNDVFARTLGPDGPVGLPVLVNERSVGYKRVSSVAMDLEGNALVVWDAARPDGKNQDVYVRRYRIR